MKIFAVEVVSPVFVVVLRAYFAMASRLSKGRPAQFLLSSLNSRCSIGFHFEVPAG